MSATQKRTKAKKNLKWQDFKVPLAIVLGLRVSLGLVGWFSTVLFPQDWDQVIGKSFTSLLNLNGPLAPLVGPWQRWDALEFERIALNGYGFRGREAAFFPLYPMLIRVVGFVVKNHGLAALLISTIAMVVALALLRKLIALDFDELTADRAVFYLAIAPTAFFLLAGYSESLFLALSVGTFLAARRGKFFVASALAALAVLSRAQGILLVAPLVLYAVSHRREGWRLQPAPLLLPLAAYLTHYLWLRNLGIPGGSMEAQEIFSSGRLVVGHPITALKHSAEVVMVNPFRSETLNLLAVLLLLFSLPLLIRQHFPWPYTAYVALSAIAILGREIQGVNPLMSAARFAVVVFPLFVLLARAGRRPWADRAIIVTCAPLQVFLFFCFTQLVFVG